MAEQERRKKEEHHEPALAGIFERRHARQKADILIVREHHDQRRAPAQRGEASVDARAPVGKIVFHGALRKVEPLC